MLYLYSVSSQTQRVEEQTIGCNFHYTYSSWLEYLLKQTQEKGFNKKDLKEQDY